MKNKSIKWILLSTIINAQGYTLNDCIDIAIGGKRTILSAELGVLSASKGLRASYSGLLHLSKQQQVQGRPNSQRELVLFLTIVILTLII